MSKVERQLSLLGALSAAVESAAARAKLLRRSTLALAFRGELVAQAPDDEPADVLLERIAAERAAEAKPERKRKDEATV